MFEQQSFLMWLEGRSWWDSEVYCQLLFFSFPTNRVSRCAFLSCQILDFIACLRWAVEWFVCVLESSLLVSLLLFLICTVDIKHTEDDGEEIIAPRLHSTWLYMDNSPPENKQNIYLSLFFCIYPFIVQNLRRRGGLIPCERILYSFLCLVSEYFCISNTQACNLKHFSSGPNYEVWNRFCYLHH